MSNNKFNSTRLNISISEEEKEKRWDTIHHRIYSREDIRNQYDGWLEHNKIVLNKLRKCNTPILDLGCGIGIDTLHLVECGYKVIACDFSSVAIEKIKENIPEAKTLCFNMKNGIPFGNEVFDFVIANKSIHYFSEQETRKLILELHRIIKPGGLFVFVVNSTNDSNFGAGQGKLLEENFYEVRGTTKRFFDKKSLEMFFNNENWEFVCMNERAIEDDRIKTVQLQTDEKIVKKVTWTCVVKKK